MTDSALSLWICLHWCALICILFFSSQVGSPSKHEPSAPVPSVSGVKRPHEDESDGEKSDEGELVVDEVSCLSSLGFYSNPDH